jgi:hypothetical protein
MVCRRDASEEVLSLLGSPVPILRRHCFPVTNESADCVYEALRVLNARFRLTPNDVLLFSSAYINEIYGLAHFQSEMSCSPFDMPMVALTFHQLFPPFERPDCIANPAERSLWLGRLRSAFEKLVSPAVMLFTTESTELSTEIAAVSGRTVGMLPFLFVPLHPRINRKARWPLTCGFLGDGRAEKGLPEVLRCIQDFFPACSDVRFVIQHIRPRGYDPGEMRQIESIIGTLRHQSNLCLVETSLAPTAFAETLREIDIMIFPYDPRHYRARASLLYVQAVAEGCLALVSKGTWMAAELERGHGAGVVFDYRSNDHRHNAEQLSEGVRKLISNFSAFYARGAEGQELYKGHHQPEVYVDVIRKMCGERDSF